MAGRVRSTVTTDRRAAATSGQPKDTALMITLESTNKSLQNYRMRAETLAKENSQLQERLKSQEVDTLEIITSLRRDNDLKDEEKRQLQDQLDNLQMQIKKEKIELAEQHGLQLQQLEHIILDKDTQIKTMQQELVEIKDFRKKRQEMIKDLEIQKAEVLDLERRHKESITRMEKKFFEEKLRLQKDANRKISELALRAHKEAVSNLDETTKSVYRENMRMVEALHHHVQLGENLEKHNASLTDENRRLNGERETHDVIIREKIVQSKYHDLEMKSLQAKILSMEHSLTHIVQEFEIEKQLLIQDTKKELDDIRRVAGVLRDSLEKKSSEVMYIKKLAAHLVQQRTDLERFFIDSLEFVRRKIWETHEKEKKEELAAIFDVTKKQAAAAAGKPKTKGRVTFEEKKVDLQDLSWRDREKILRLLFAKMNGVLPDRLATAATDSLAECAMEKQDTMILDTLNQDKIDPEKINELTEYHRKVMQDQISQHSNKDTVKVTVI